MYTAGSSQPPLREPTCKLLLFPPPRGANKLLWLYQRLHCLTDMYHLTSFTDMLFHRTTEESEAVLCCGFSPSLLTLGVYSGVIYLDCWWTELDLCYARHMEKERRHLREVYDFEHRNNLPVCIFRLWTWASLNFGELNLYLPPQLKIQARSRECGPSRLKEILFCFKLLFQTMSFCVSCLRVMYIYFFCLYLFKERLLFFDECTIFVINNFTELCHFRRFLLHCFAMVKMYDFA